MDRSQSHPQATVSRPLPDQPNATPQQSEPATPLLAVLGRLTWMLFGPLAVVLSAITLVGKDKALLSLADAGYFTALAAMLLGRCVEFSSGHALTATGEPATTSHLRRYLIGAAAIGLGVWLLVKAAGSFGLLG